MHTQKYDGSRNIVLSYIYVVHKRKVTQFGDVLCYSILLIFEMVPIESGYGIQKFKSRFASTVLHVLVLMSTTCDHSSAGSTRGFDAGCKPGV